MKAPLKEILKNPSLHLSRNHLQTNTWPGRNRKKLERLEAEILKTDLRNVEICIVGPGAVSDSYASLLPNVDEEEIGIFRKKWKNLVNIFETHDRNQPNSALRSFEPLEVYNLLNREVGVKKMTIIDKYPRVLRAAQALPIPIELDVMKADIDDPSVVLPKAQVYISFNTLPYCNNTFQAYSALCKPLSQEGFLAVTFPERGSPYLRGFQYRAKNVYMKDNATAPIWHRAPPAFNDAEIVAAMERVAAKK